jgi:hypothetical protein
MMMQTVGLVPAIPDPKPAYPVTDPPRSVKRVKGDIARVDADLWTRIQQVHLSTANPPPAVPIADLPLTEYKKPASLNPMNPSSTLGFRCAASLSSESGSSDLARAPKLSLDGDKPMPGGIEDFCMN